MATFRFSVLGNERPDSGVFLDTVANQITEEAAPSVGNLLCYVLADGGADEGLYFSFSIPKNYVGSPKLVIKGILDGAPSNGHDLAFGFRKRAVANNEAADGTFDAEETVQDADIGGTGTNYSDEDAFEMSITLTAAHYAVDDIVYGYAYIDASQTTYTGNVLLMDIQFEYADA